MNYPFIIDQVIDVMCDLYLERDDVSKKELYRAIILEETSNGRRMDFDMEIEKQSHPD